MFRLNCIRSGISIFDPYNPPLLRRCSLRLFKIVLTIKQNRYSCTENILLKELMNKLLNNIIGACGIMVWCWRAFTQELAGDAITS
ncbi:MAG: hypothetical protein KKH97_08285 [Proteobacteria bacterium]|nr:hypothetical protein [Pseudomonadota bacterium]